MSRNFKRLFWSSAKTNKKKADEEKKPHKATGKKLEYFWLTKLVTNFLMGRKSKELNRYLWEMSARTQPQPRIPKGPHHLLSGNNYFKRAAKKEVKPPQVLYNWVKPIPIPIQLEDKETQGKALHKEFPKEGDVSPCPEPQDPVFYNEELTVIPKTPGSKIHNWDDHRTNCNFYVPGEQEDEEDEDDEEECEEDEDNNENEENKEKRKNK